MLHLTIEPTQDAAEFKVIEHDHYPDHSVLAGESRRSVIDYFPTVQAARAVYPKARVMKYSTGDPFGPRISDVAPSWFDPGACGEVWHEDDY